ncbi:putative signal peptide protein [Puccinia sorghi]|uniref:Putative signal peptide protein n=1 Tax=Puccinia sorghi TaxID=27349 RepID=A0A0L6UYQ4_9BASI|nr:putative signal peptide protein [Puccinia sorghi]
MFNQCILVILIFFPTLSIVQNKMCQSVSKLHNTFHKLSSHLLDILHS